MKKNIYSKRASILLMTMMFMVVLVIVSTVYLSTVKTNNTNIGHQYINERALYLAEAGIYKAIWYLRNTAPDNSTNATWRTTAYPAAAGNTAPAACTATDPCEESLENGTYLMWVEASGNNIQITSKGTYNGLSRTVRVSVVNLTFSDGLVAWWKFDEGAGTTAADSSGNGKDGDLTGHAPTWTTGVLGGGLNFDGTSNYVDAAVNIDTYSQVTLSAWVYPTENGTTSPSGYRQVFGNDNGSYDRALSAGGSGWPTKWTIFNGNSSYGTDIIVALNQWSYVTVVYGSSTEFYINGLLVFTAPVSSGYSGSAALQIGRSYYNAGAGSSFFKGKIDNVRIYSRALPSEAVRKLYIKEALVAHWKFDDGAGATATDSSGNGNDGDLTGHAPSWVAGHLGSGALSFAKASSQYISVDTTAIKEQFANLSISLWYKTSTAGYMQFLCRGQAVWELQFHTGSYPNLYVHSTGDPARWNFLLRDGNWHHLVTTFNDIDDVVKSYFDGTLSMTSSGRTASIPVSANALNIGRRVDAGTEFFDGSMDDVRVYGAVLSGWEIAQLHNEENSVENNEEIGIVKGTWQEL